MRNAERAIKLCVFAFAILFLGNNFSANGQIHTVRHLLKANTDYQFLAPGEVFEVCVAGRYNRISRREATSIFVFLKITDDELADEELADEEGEIFPVFIETDQLKGQQRQQQQMQLPPNTGWSSEGTVGRLDRCRVFSAPSVPGQYTLSLSEQIAGVPRRWGIGGAIRAKDRLTWAPSATFTVRDDRIDRGSLYRIALDAPEPDRRNEQDKPIYEGGVRGDPFEFQWFPEASDDIGEIEYRHRIYPGGEWTDWSKTQDAHFSYIHSGQYSFEVESRYDENSLTDVDAITRAFALRPKTWSFAFTVLKPLASRPAEARNSPSILGKGDDDSIWSGVDASALDQLRNQILDEYPVTKALVGGVSSYDDPAEWEELIAVANDIKAVGSAFEARDFVVTPMEENPDKNSLLTSLNQFSESIEHGDRVIIYLSMHGFARGNTKPYLAPRGCKKDNHLTTCISIESIKDTIQEEMIELNGAKQVLLILDACSSGLGFTQSKSEAIRPFLEIDYVREPVFKLFTAGLANQKAYVDTDESLSYFTKHFLAGFDGDADYNQDGVVTSTELDIFVRYEVLRETYAFSPVQSPIGGSVSGNGEMAFLSVN